jgi:hypothetical protein
VGSVVTEILAKIAADPNSIGGLGLFLFFSLAVVCGTLYGIVEVIVNRRRK